MALASLLAVSTGLLVAPTRPAIRVSRGGVAPSMMAAQAVTSLETPADTYFIGVAKGVANSKLSTAKTLHASLVGGMQVGIGGLLCLVTCGALPGLAATNPGFVKFVFASLFPVCLMLILASGGQLYTGNTASLASAYWEGKVTKADVLKSWGLSWFGNFIGCLSMVWVGSYTGILSGGGAAMVAGMGVAKTAESSFMKMVVKGIFCNYLVCMAIFLATQARDMMGRYISIWVAVSTFVMTGYEHSVANMYLLPAALVAGTTASAKDMIFKNLIPVTIGNGIAGSILVALSFSYAFGKVGGCARDDECEVGESGADEPAK